MADNALADDLAQLRRESVAVHDPMGWAYLQALAARWQVASPAVRAGLQPRWTAAVGLSLERTRKSREERRARVSHGSLTAGGHDARDATSALGVLARHARAAAMPAGSASDQRPLLRSAVRFHDMWARMGAEQDLEEAFGRAPENAGPLNPHMLVLKTLRQMQSLSPAYLQRFMTQAEGLLWLTEARQEKRPATTRGKPRPSSRKTQQG
ncbi:DUF2894 domain-containing protein [Hydrogenophaga sp. 5NK40-0174]|uniref:DUF2894 domain-containing protein n=1 Tax=Hydrogenophaga sp. 5NK40-0174 TaxID=3127649 RepID=UPI0033422DAA